MNKEEALYACLIKLRELEEQEQKVISFQRQAQQVTDEAFYDIQSVTNMYDDYETLNIARRELDKLEFDFLDALMYEKRNLNIQIEDLEDEYRKLRFEIENK